MVSQQLLIIMNSVNLRRKISIFYNIKQNGHFGLPGKEWLIHPENGVKTNTQTVMNWQNV